MHNLKDRNNNVLDIVIKFETYGNVYENLRMTPKISSTSKKHSWDPKKHLCKKCYENIWKNVIFLSRNVIQRFFQIFTILTLTLRDHFFSFRLTYGKCVTCFPVSFAISINCCISYSCSFFKSGSAETPRKICK